ncbi:MAG: hypothetical protein KDK39_05300 [Leptospiraceae bacterium]|nr:hypothetical protein [Leptospiraceae bacterium]
MMTKRSKKAIAVSLVIIVSSLFMYALRLGLVLPNPVVLRQMGPYYLVLRPQAVARQETAHENDEAVILNTTRLLYESGVLADGHKAQAMTLQRSNGQKFAGLALSADLYAAALASRNADLAYVQIPADRMLTISIPRLNLLSLYVGEHSAIPQLMRSAADRGYLDPLRLEIYDRRITYIVPPHFKLTGL